MTVMLEIEAITVHYGRLAAVRGLSLTIGAGEIVCIAGPNGAGKSTTMLAIAGALKPSSGAIRLEGNVITGAAAEEIARAGVSLVPEGRHIFGALTVEENLLIGTHMRRDRPAIVDDLESVYRQFPFLRERRRQRAGKLSGGEQQQLAIARALMTRPRLMLIDEPALGLAPLIVDGLYQEIARLRDAGVTLLIVEQSAERATIAADRVLIMRSGTVVLEGRSDELGDADALRRAYFGGT
jgi:branched-chain amino acid transport system ATP-binding protein